DEEKEIQAGLEAVLATLQDNYVRPDEANIAQSKVATRGRYRFIDKVHVNYIEREKRHWAALENFNSQRVAVAERFYLDNERILEGGIWAEVTIGFNDIDEDDYTFFIEDLRPIQLSRLDYEGYIEGRSAFTRDEWLDIILRSVGLEPPTLTHRQKFHFITRLASLVEPNFNFIELGPRGTGKSYFFSEFSPYSTLISGGQTSKAILFYNNARKRVGLVGFWDVIAFDEVAGIKIKDPDTAQIMKDYMANGRFSRGVDVIADASLAFNGNIDYSIKQLVNSIDHDLFLSLPEHFDLAIMDRFAFYLPGWEMPKTSSHYLTNNYGFITDYLAEAFHHQFTRSNRYEEASSRVKLGSNVEGRDEKAIKKTLSAFLKILHPDGPPTDKEFDEYVAYAIEGRRRVKEQMNKRKPDDEFAKIQLSFINSEDQEIIITCPESESSVATQEPTRRNLKGDIVVESGEELSVDVVESSVPDQVISDIATESMSEPEEKHFTIFYGDTGYSYEKIFGPYLQGAKVIQIEDPFIRMPHQIQNFVRLCEAIVKLSNIKRIELITGYDDEYQNEEAATKLDELRQSLLELDVVFEFDFNPLLHDREIRLDNGWVLKIGRGLDFYQKPLTWHDIGTNDLSLRKCLETKVDVYKE
ncbi:MAG: BREX system Lon protease-like protein BrxL, partial [Anaerolineaceae bacterium]|nr:BREX system Lon protease-like protein BrxL [Anaerolineaceae bacterium]